MEEYHRLLAFLKDCLSAQPQIADWDRIDDTQTQILLKYLRKQETSFSILDYGCGNMRLLNALANTVENTTSWHYVGYDPHISGAVIREINNSAIPKDCTWETRLRNELLQMGAQFDFVVVQNVLHEIGIFDTASLLQDCRILLKASGELLVLDTPLLPKGEPDFVPLFDWDMPILFKQDATKMSETSPKGLPILFYAVPGNCIPYYAATLRLYPQLLELKQNTFSHLAYQVSLGQDTRLLELLHLGLDRFYDYVYLNVVVGNITRRLHERERHIPTESEISELGTKIVRFLDSEDTFRMIDIYTHFCQDYRYETICAVLQLMINNWMFLLTKDTHDGSQKLLPSEIFDILIDKVGGKEIGVIGLEEALLNARTKFGNDFPGSFFGI